MTNARDFQKGDRVVELVRVGNRRGENLQLKQNEGTVTKIERKTVKVRWDKDGYERRMIPNRIRLLTQVDPQVRNEPGRYPVEAFAVFERPAPFLREGVEVGVVSLGDLAEDEPQPVPKKKAAKKRKQQARTGPKPRGTEEPVPIPSGFVAAMQTAEPEPDESESELDLPPDCTTTGMHNFMKHEDGIRLVCTECGYKPPPRCKHNISEDTCFVCLELATRPVRKETETQTPIQDDEAGTASEQPEIVMTDDNKDAEAATELVDDALNSLDVWLSMGDDFKPVLQQKKETLVRDIIAKQNELLRIERAITMLDNRPPAVKPVPDPKPEPEATTKKRATRTPPRRVDVSNVRRDIVIGGRDHITLERAVNLAGVSQSTLYRKVQEGKLSLAKKGGRTYFAISELERLRFRNHSAARVAS